MVVDPNLIDLAEITDLCIRMVQTPSVNGQHPEKDLTAQIAETARAWGLEVELSALEPERPNVLVHAGPSGETALLLIGHLDTVPVGDPDAWSCPPFGGEIAGGRLYGRGAIDTKGGMTAALAALRLLKDHYADRLTCRVTFVGVPDEESGATGRLGVRYLHGIGKLTGRGAIYVYPDMDKINIGHRGVWRFRLSARGTSLHTGSLEWQHAPKGFNALTGLAEIARKLEDLRFPAGTQDPYLKGLDTVVTPTVLQAGVAQGIVPDRAELFVDVRLVPAVPREDVVRAVERVVEEVSNERPPLEVTMETLIDLPPTIITDSTPLVKCLQAVAAEVTGLSPELVVSGPANESYLLNGMGIPTCTFGPVGAGAHAVDEYVELDSLRAAAAVYAQTALRMM